MGRILPSLLPFIGVILLLINAANGLSNSASCGQTNFTTDTGTVAFAPQSTANKDCTYVIRTKKDTRIVLKWRSFSVDGDMPKCRTSSVTIYHGCSSTKLIDFCSKNTDSLPHDIYTRDNCLKLVFKSNQATKEEFSATYYTADENKPVSSSTYCSSKKKMYAKSGVIISPGWPKGYGQLWNDCEWDIKLSSRYLIKVTFMDIDIYKSSYSCRSSKERLRLKGEKSFLTSYEKKNYYCGKYLPFTLNTRYYELEFEFDTKGYRRRNRGFVVGYVAYKTTDSVSTAKRKTKIGYIIIAIVAVLVIGGVAYYLWRKRRNSGMLRQTEQSYPNSAETKPLHTYRDSSAPAAAPPQMAAPPPYSAAATQPGPGYQGYQPQPYPVASYPAQQAGAPYPTDAPPFYPPTSGAPPPDTGMAPYPGAGAPYPGAGAPHSGAGAPYPGAGAPYPGAGAPYPTGGPPQYPTETKQGPPY